MSTVETLKMLAEKIMDIRLTKKNYTAQALIRMIMENNGMADMIDEVLQKIPTRKKKDSKQSLS
eukprot:12398447-Karenia_brevis.AAC.1